MKKLWNDECGAVVSAELVMVMTILGLGVIVGLKAVQASIDTEMGDVATAIGKTNQSYDYTGVSLCDSMAGVAGSQFLDGEDGCIDIGPGNPVDVTTPAAAPESN